MKKIIILILLTLLVTSRVNASAEIVTDKFVKVGEDECVKLHKGSCVPKSIANNYLRLVTYNQTVFCDDNMVCVGRMKTCEETLGTCILESTFENDKSKYDISFKGGECAQSAEGTTHGNICVKVKAPVAPPQVPGPGTNAGVVNPVRPATEANIENFCTYNPTYADIQADNLKSKRPGSNVVFDKKEVMSKEECMAWVKGDDSYQKFKKEADPDVTKSYIDLMTLIKSQAQPGSGVFTNIDTTIKELESTMNNQRAKIVDYVDRIVAPPIDGTPTKKATVEQNTSSANIATEQDYIAKCISNNPGISPLLIVNAQGQASCPLGYSGQGLAYGDIITQSGRRGIHCCVKDDNFLKFCKGVVRLKKDCKDQKKSSTNINGKEITCCKQ